MKKDILRSIRLNKKRERKHLKRARKKKFYIDFFHRPNKDIEFRKNHDQDLIDKLSLKLDDFLIANGNKSPKDAATRIEIPKRFSLEDDYESTIETLALLRKSLLKFLGGKIIIDFKDCELVGFSSLFLLKVVLDEYLTEFKKLDKKLLIYKTYPIVHINYSKTQDVNLKLYANKLIVSADLGKADFIPISSLGVITGTKSQRHYTENKKGIVATQIRSYINKSLNRHKFTLNSNGDSFLDGLISEILNNAEDHSLFNKWYAFANLFETRRLDENSDVVGEINLAFLNFGYSIFEGFEETKEDNFALYNEMQQLFELVSEKSSKRLNKESMFTLYALQEGFSRLKYIKESRGTGTIKFIRSFLNLGDYKNVEKGFDPHLLIYSGNTFVKCDNLYKPYKIDDVYYLSLNSSNDLTLPPEKSHLKELKFKFPGTFLIAKIYLNEKHLTNKFVK